MAQQWYYADRQNQQQGPIDSASLARAYREGVVSAATLVWRDGMPGWVPLSQVAAQLGLIIVGAAAGSVAAAAPARTGTVARAPTGGSGSWVIVVVVLLVGFIAVLAILAAIALPAYQDYTMRAKATEGIIAADGIKVAVAEFFDVNSKCPTNADEGFQPAASYAAGVVGSIRIAPDASGRCAFTVTYRNFNSTPLAGKYIQWTMDQNLHWTTKTDLPAKYLPMSMRN